MPIITLTTDLGSGNFHLSTVKVNILSRFEGCHVVDISHEVTPYDIAEAAFIIRSVMADFPDGTVHIIGVGEQSLDGIRHLAISHRNQYLLCADNGILSLITDHQPDQMVELTAPASARTLTFPTRDLYAPAAAHLAQGKPLEGLGTPTTDFAKRTLLQPVIGEGYIKGMVTYVDSYGNATSNISRALFDEVGKGRAFLIGFIHKGYEIDTIEQRYSDTPEGDRLAMFNSANLLEIAINRGHAANLLGLHKGETVIVTFDD